jgi:hypothetical protein
LRAISQPVLSSSINSLIFVLQATSNDPISCTKTAQAQNYGYINTFCPSLAAANHFHIDASNSNSLVSSVSDTAIPFITDGDAMVWVQTVPGGGPAGWTPLSCSTTGPGAGVLTCTASYGDVVDDVLQYFNEGSFVEDPTGVSIDTQVDAGCQAIQLTAIPVCAMVSTFA